MSKELISNNVTLEDIQEHTKLTYKEQHDLSQLAIALGGEIGEFLNLVKKINRAALGNFDKANKFNVTHLRLLALFEIADILYYSGESFNELVKHGFKDLTLSDIWRIKININDVKYGRKEQYDPETKQFLLRFNLLGYDIID